VPAYIHFGSRIVLPFLYPNQPEGWDQSIFRSPLKLLCSTCVPKTSKGEFISKFLGTLCNTNQLLKHSLCLSARKDRNHVALLLPSSPAPITIVRMGNGPGAKRGQSRDYNALH
jgi:hypothetical protein